MPRPRIKSTLDALAAEVLAATWQLCDDLMVKYADGGVTTAQLDGSAASKDLGYPAEWLSAVGFAGGPPRLGLPAVTQNPTAPAANAAATAQRAAPGLSPLLSLARRGADAVVPLHDLDDPPAAPQQPLDWSLAMADGLVALAALVALYTALLAVRCAAAGTPARGPLHADGGGWTVAAVRREAIPSAEGEGESAYVPL